MLQVRGTFAVLEHTNVHTVHVASRLKPLTVYSCFYSKYVSATIKNNDPADRDLVYSITWKSGFHSCPNIVYEYGVVYDFALVLYVFSH